MRRAAAPATLALLVAYEAVVGLWIYYGFREGHAGALGVALWAAAELAGLVLGAYGGAWRFLLAPLPARSLPFRPVTTRAGSCLSGSPFRWRYRLSRSR